MLLAVDKRNDLVTPENKLERLYLIQYLMEVKESIENQTFILEEQLNTIKSFLKSGKAHYEGSFIDFPTLETAEIFSLLSRSLTTEQIVKFSIKENADYFLGLINRINSIDRTDKTTLVNFISSLINNLSVQNTETPRNFFDW